jgi:hypothetical protein
MMGTVVLPTAQNINGLVRTTGIIVADGTFYDQFDPRWINQPAPRDGRYFFIVVGTFSDGDRVTFDASPGGIQPGGTFETASVAHNVQAA